MHTTTPASFVVCFPSPICKMQMSVRSLQIYCQSSYARCAGVESHRNCFFNAHQLCASEIGSNGCQLVVIFITHMVGVWLLFSLLAHFILVWWSISFHHTTVCWKECKQWRTSTIGGAGVEHQKPRHDGLWIFYPAALLPHCPSYAQWQPSFR